MRCSSAMSTRMFFTRSGIDPRCPSAARSQDEGERVRLRAEIVHPLDERNHLLPLLLLGGLLDARVEIADGRLGAEIVSPESCSTRRSTPCVLGCCGPMLTVIVSLRSSGIVSCQFECVQLQSCFGARWPPGNWNWPSLHQFAQHVQQRPVDLLHARGVVVGDVHVNLGGLSDAPAVASGQRNRPQPARSGGLAAPLRRSATCRSSRSRTPRHRAGRALRSAARRPAQRSSRCDRSSARWCRSSAPPPASAGRSRRNRPTSSAAMCCASDALPPLPKISSFRPACSASGTACAAASTGPRLLAHALVQRDRRRDSDVSARRARSTHRHPSAATPAAPVRSSARCSRTPRGSAAAARRLSASS